MADLEGAHDLGGAGLAQRERESVCIFIGGGEYIYIYWRTWRARTIWAVPGWRTSHSRRQRSKQPVSTKLVKQAVKQVVKLEPVSTKLVKQGVKQVVKVEPVSTKLVKQGSNKWSKLFDHLLVKQRRRESEK